MPVKIVYRLALLGLVGSQGAWAQTAPTPTPTPVEAAKSDPAKDAFLAFSEADRKAAQDALVWLGLYNGVDDGAFGKRTREAIEAYQKKTGAMPDGVATPDLISYLKAAGDKPRVAAGFAAFDEPSTGARVSAPLKWLDKRTQEPGHARLASRDGAITLDIFAQANSDETLDSMFKRLSAESGDRKVAYKALKPDAFFVVSGEDGATKFYQRYAKGPNGALRGFEFRYPKARADALDRVAIAVANGFEPFPTAGAAPTPVASAAPAPTPTPATPPLVATAFVIAPGQALTVLAPAECAEPRVAGAPATFGRVDPASGLARLDGDFGAGVAPTRFGEDGADAILFSRAPGAAADKSPLEASRGDWSASGGRASLVVSAAATARGAPILNGRGELLGVLGAMKTPPRKIGGVAIAEPREAIAGATLKAFLADGRPAAGAPMTAPELARRFGARALAVTCAS